MNFIKTLFRIEKKPAKGLFALEWAMMGYLVFTLLLMLFTYTKLADPVAMLWGRVQIVAMTVALWAVYRMVPCRFTRLCRIVAQMALLSWWYPDTYEFNRMFSNLDHVFARYEQTLFGCQPSLLFAEKCGNAVFSELMCLGYTAYYPMIALVTLFFFVWRYEQFGRASFIVLTSFFIYYLIYIFVPVAGPQYYYEAVGLDRIAAGSFPDIGHYFADHTTALATPGWSGGFFYDMVREAHDAGERPTAAFPSSHVGVSTILMLLAWSSRNRRLLCWLTPLYVLLCLSTVYIYAHYAIDVLAGWVSAVMIYAALHVFYTRLVGKE